MATYQRPQMQLKVQVWWRDFMSVNHLARSLLHIDVTNTCIQDMPTDKARPASSSRLVYVRQLPSMLHQMTASMVPQPSSGSRTW